MPEQQNIVGDKWTRQSVELMELLGWTQVGTSNFDITCTKHDTRNGQGHGIDSLFKFYDPYYGRDIKVIVESKNRQWSGLAPAQLKIFIQQVIGTIECACDAPELAALNANDVYTGLILCWCNDGNYRHDLYVSRINEIGFRNKNFRCEIFIAGNNDLLRWYSLTQEINSLREQNLDFKIYYPSIDGDKRSNGGKYDHISLVHLYSKYIFAYGERQVNLAGNSIFVTSSYVFMFDEVTNQSLMLLYDACKQYQMQLTKELVIYLYAQEENVRGVVAEFKRQIGQDEQELTIKYLPVLDGLDAFPIV